MTRTTKLLAGLGLFAAFSANAALPPPERKPEPQFEVGVLGGIGLNFPSLGNSSSSSSAQLGFSGGGFAAYHIDPQLSLELDALYAYQSSTQVTTLSQISVSTSISKSVLEVPVFLRYWFVPQFGVGVGPYAAFGMGNYTVAGVSEDYTTYQKNRAEFGVAASVEGRLPVGREANALLDVRYLQGLTNLDTDGLSSDSVTDRQLEILAGISFSL
jgi:hypothetical protein